MVHPTRTGQYLTYCFEVTASLKELKEFFFKVFVISNFLIQKPSSKISNKIHKIHVGHWGYQIKLVFSTKKAVYLGLSSALPFSLIEHFLL